MLEVLDEKQAPVFTQADVEVEVAENSPSTTYVGEAIVAATDEDKGTTLTYSLVGDDAASFAIAEDTTRQIQIVVGHPAELNKEEKNSYTFELEASDGALDDTLTVTITVTDRNEAPSTPVEGKDAPAPGPTPANNAPVFPDTETGMRSVAENTATGMPTSEPRSWPWTTTPATRSPTRWAALTWPRSTIRHGHRPDHDKAAATGLRDDAGGRRYGQRLRGYRHSQ